jgi:hypothetical protein
VEWIRNIGRHVAFWIPIVLIVAFLARKPVTYLVGQWEETPRDNIKIFCTALDDPFTPVLWVLDVKQPITAEECNKTDGWLPLVALSQVAGVFSMLVMLLSSVLGSVLGVLAWWDYVHQNASDDDVAFYPWSEWPIQIRMTIICAWSYFLIATALSRWVA